MISANHMKHNKLQLTIPEPAPVITITFPLTSKSTGILNEFFWLSVGLV
jgi:hypothetical protein